MPARQGAPFFPMASCELLVTAAVGARLRSWPGIFVLTEGLFVAYEEDFRPESVLTCALCLHAGNGGDLAPKEFLIHESAKESRRGRRAPAA
ncbi:hypothetical protein KL86DES1_21400 [uncultured Desulfovibrio sp.]|uniref:Uncharacterized protein n=1 Tax=uncultured Desulfovibrio sp. TaxID=167968 RepID=A0A212L8C4_9BACT|nr:hypothetical protein KL86DES1_21400 [uncultured Desulfovibrio sp.]VZH34297.1 conserved protein of unknown function [Desulfovibrio sp. 86]